MCPAPAPKPKNITYYGNAAAAEAAGFRPCLRCRPELAPGAGAWRRGDEVVARALKLIDEGALAEHPLSALAARVNLGERQLRRLFVDRLGAAPIGVHGTRRLLFAKQLLTETTLPVTEVALAAGFGSLRRFNTTFREAYRMAPRDLRKRPRADIGDALTLRLGYRPPFDFAAMLAFLRGRALPGVERVDDDSYARVIGPAATPGWLRVSAWGGGEHALNWNCTASRRRDCWRSSTACAGCSTWMRTRRRSAMRCRRARACGRCCAQHPGLRLPSGWDGFEIAVRAILGQQVSVAAARTLATRLAQQFGEALPAPFGPGLEHLFPTPDALADADLTRIGLTRARADTVRAMAQALLDGRVDFKTERVLEDFTARWVALPGIGPWTAQYIAMRALGHPDAFPTDDLVLRRAASDDGSTLGSKALAERAEAWRPWRAYAVMHLWREAMSQPRPRKQAQAETDAVRIRR